MTVYSVGYSSTKHVARKKCAQKFSLISSSPFFHTLILSASTVVHHFIHTLLDNVLWGYIDGVQGVVVVHHLHFSLRTGLASSMTSIACMTVACTHP